MKSVVSLLALASLAAASSAAVVDSGIVNLLIPNTVDGLFVNVITGGNSTTDPASLTNPATSPRTTAT